MKDKIVEILKELHHPPSKWYGHPKDKIPTWEGHINKAAEKIAHLYSAGEEVYVECGKDDGYEFLVPKWDKKRHGIDYRYFKKLTHPTVSEKEIESFVRKSLQVVKINANQVALVDFKEYILYEATIQTMVLAIKELLSRKDEG